jgi:hypothetical protein
MKLFNVQPAYAEGFGVAGAHLSRRSPAQRGEGGTFNAQRSIQAIKRWTLGVGR